MARFFYLTQETIPQLVLELNTMHDKGLEFIVIALFQQRAGGYCAVVEIEPMEPEFTFDTYIPVQTG